MLCSSMLTFLVQRLLMMDATRIVNEWWTLVQAGCLAKRKYNRSSQGQAEKYPQELCRETFNLLSVMMMQSEARGVCIAPSSVLLLSSSHTFDLTSRMKRPAYHHLGCIFLEGFIISCLLIVLYPSLLKGKYREYDKFPCSAFSSQKLTILLTYLIYSSIQLTD